MASESSLSSEKRVKLQVDVLPRPHRVLTLLFPGFELLDVAGPLEIFSVVDRVLADAEAAASGDHPCTGYALRTCVLDEAHGEKVESTGGIKFVADFVASSAHTEPFDTLVIPGGAGVRSLCTDAAYIRRLAALAQRAQVRVVTVCTGSALLAMTGLLANKRATSNKRAWRWVTQELGIQGVDWSAASRWCADEPFWTSSGVAAGTDMACALVAKDFGMDVAEAVVKRIEYVWQRSAEEGEEGGFARAWGVA